MEADGIGGRLAQATPYVPKETGPKYDVVGAGGVVDLKGLPAAIMDDQALKIVADALGVGTEPPAFGGGNGGLGHVNSIVMTLGNGQPLKRIVPGVAHENTQIVARQYRVGDEIVVEGEVQ